MVSLGRTRSGRVVRLRALRTLIMIAELKSFSKAAAHLNTTQPAISARIRGLEEALGCKLVLREGREVRLSTDGVEVLRYAKPIVDLTDRLGRLFRPRSEIAGTIRIGAIDTIIYSWMFELFERLRENHPDVNYEVRADTSVNLIDDLLRGEVDVALVMGPVDGEGIVNMPLGEFPMAWVCNPVRYGFDREIDVRDLIAHPIISYPRGSKPYRMIENYFAGQAKVPRLNCSNSLSTLIRLVKDGYGVATIPPVLIRSELDSGKLKIVPVRQTFPALSCHVAYYATAEAAAPGLVARLARVVSQDYWSREAARADAFRATAAP